MRLLVVRVGILDRSGKPAFATQCDEAALKTALWGGRYNIAAQFSDSSFNKFVLTNHSAAKAPGRVVSVQTNLRVATFPANMTDPSIDIWNTASTWVAPITTAVAAAVPDYAQYSFLLLVVPEALGGPLVAANIISLGTDPTHPSFWFGGAIVRPSSAVQATAFMQRALNYGVFDDWDFPSRYDRSDLETPTNNANGSLPVTWVRYNTAERWLANWIPSSNVREQPVDAAGWRALGASGLTLKSSSVAPVKTTDTLTFIIKSQSLLSHVWFAVSFRTRPNVTGSFDDNLPTGWYDRVFVHVIDDEFLRPQLVSVLAPGQSYVGYEGAGFKFASIDKPSASARLAFCTPAPPRVTVTKPTGLPNGTYPSLVLQGGSCSQGKTFKGALVAVVANPSVGCGPVRVPPLDFGRLNTEFSYVEWIEGFDFAKQGAAGDASVRSGASTTQTYDITVSPGTPATTVQLYYTLEEMISLFDLTIPVRTVNLVYTCT